MPHLPTTRPLADAAAYQAALDELMALDASAAPSVKRRNELTWLIEDYQAQRAGYDLPRMRQALADWK